MKKEHVIKVAATKEHIRTITEYDCDVCKELIGNNLYRKNVCDICEAHVHNNYKCGTDHPEDHGDYPRTLCSACLHLYNTLMVPLLQKHEEEEMNMLIRIKNERK